MEVPKYLQPQFLCCRELCTLELPLHEVRVLCRRQQNFHTSGKQISGLKSIFQKCESFVADGKEHEPHEEVIRECIIHDNIKIEVEDISGLPWIEIDFPEDIVRATETVLPQLLI